MGVRFILGENPVQKREEMIDHIYNHLEENMNAEVIYLVPDNVKYEAETMVLEQFKKRKKTKKAGMIRLQIFSFSRLAWYLLQDQAIYQQSQLTESGLGMLLKKILKDEEENLTIYRGTSQKTGFIQRLITLFSEFRNGKIDPDDLEEILIAKESENEGKDFKKKIEDISHLYKKYDQALKDSYLEREDLYRELISYLSRHAQDFDQTTIYVDHYEHFSAQELGLLLELGKYSKNLLIALTLDRESIKENNSYNQLFYRPSKSYFQLRNAFKNENIDILENTFIDYEKDENLELEKLRKYWIQSNRSIAGLKNQVNQDCLNENIELWETENIDAEVFHIASEIKKRIETEEYRYKDFQIMTRNLSDYELSFEAVFNKNNIPFFIDEKESMAQHPLLEFLMSLFLLKKRYFRMDDIFRFLRTELFLPMEEDKEEGNKIIESVSDYQNQIKKWREQVDVAENVALAFGYQGKDWIQDEKWHYGRMNLDDESILSVEEKTIENEANRVREVFRKKILPFLNSLDDLKTNKELADSLYQFMETIQVPEQLEFWWNQQAEQGQLEEAKRHEQAWQQFIAILDEFVEILGEEDWDLDSFLSIIETGFEEATYSILPPTIDQVLITNYDLPKIQAKKVVFLIDLTDTSLPQVKENQSLLTDEDREVFQKQLESDKYLADSDIETMANEPFGFYLALFQAKEKIYFTYPSTNNDQKENRMSPYIKRIKEEFSLEKKIKYAHSISIPKSSKNPFDNLDYLGSKDQAFSEIIISLRDSLDNLESPDAFWSSLFNHLYDASELRDKYILNSLIHKNIPIPLGEELAEKLYGENLFLSVSQLESFFTDPYSHFLIYGLKIRERQLQELTPLESGNFYHDALDSIIKKVIQSSKDITLISKKELDKIMKETFKNLLESKKYRLAQSSKRLNFIFNQLTRTVKNMIWSMIQQSKRSRFRPEKTELVFGQIANQRGIEGLSFDLKGQRKLHLRGKIDRVDSFKNENQLFAGVVDYKSSPKNFNYQNIYHGLMLQMITYLDTVISFSKEIFGEKALGMGAFYSTVTDHFLDLQKLGQKDIEEEKLKQYKNKGIIIYREEILEAADTLLEAKEISPIYPVRLLTNGNYSKNQTITQDEFDWLIRFNREKIIEAGNKIISGDNQLSPYDKRQAKIFTPSVDGPYRAISQFDPLLKENNYQDIKKINQKEFFKELKKRYTDEQEGN